MTFSVLLSIFSHFAISAHLYSLENNSVILLMSEIHVISQISGFPVCPRGSVMFLMVSNRGNLK